MKAYTTFFDKNEILLIDHLGSVQSLVPYQSAIYSSQKLYDNCLKIEENMKNDR